MSKPFFVTDRRRDSLALGALFLANIAVLFASWRHLVAGFGQLELAGDRFAAVAAATAVDGAILALSYTLAHRRLADRDTRPMIGAVGFLVLLSMALNVDDGISVVLSKLQGQPVAGLWRMAELQAIDWLAIARVAFYRGSLPVTNLLLSIAVDRVARSAHVVESHEPVVAPGPYAPPPDISALHRHEYAAPPPRMSDYGKFTIEVPREAVEHPPRSVGEWAEMRREQERRRPSVRPIIDELTRDEPEPETDLFGQPFMDAMPPEGDLGDVEEFGGAAPDVAERLNKVIRYIAGKNGERITVLGMANDLGFSERTGWRSVSRLRRAGIVREDALQLTRYGAESAAKGSL